MTNQRKPNLRRAWQEGQRKRTRKTASRKEFKPRFQGDTGWNQQQAEQNLSDLKDARAILAEAINSLARAGDLIKRYGSHRMGGHGSVANSYADKLLPIHRSLYEMYTEKGREIARQQRAVETHGDDSPAWDDPRF